MFVAFNTVNQYKKFIAIISLIKNEIKNWVVSQASENWH